MKRRLLILSLSAVLAACGGKPAATDAAAPAPAKAASPTPAGMDKLYADYWDESLRLDPLTATFSGDHRFDDQLPNYLSADYRKQQHDFRQRWLDRLAGIDAGGFGEDQRLSYDILARSLKEQLEGERFPDWKQPISQFYSIPNILVLLGSGSGAQPFKTVDDYEHWLKRAAQVPVLFDQAIANMREGMASGVTQPKLLMQRVLPQLDGVVADDPTKTPFWTPIAQLPKDMPEADRSRLAEAYRKAISTELVPAFRKLRTFIADEYIPAARTTDGYQGLPDGDAWYAYNAKVNTTTDMSPAQIHELGLKEVARIRGEMETLKAQVGFKGDLKAFFRFMDTDKRFQFASENELLARYRALEGKVNQRIPELFSLTPKARFEIRPVKAFRAASEAAGSYMQPSEDGSRPGIFYVNTYDLPSRKTWGMESLYLHEAIPGHHFQIALQQELKGVPAFRRFGGQTAYIEGWALYAESLGKDLGVYTDPYMYFGRLNDEMWRAIRLVVDTGLHSKGWTRQQVLDYMADNSGVSETERVAEAERYMAIPGQALGYKMGELKIIALREKARQALGDKFDIRDFHAEVLGEGSLPLDVLEARIDRWIAARKVG